jgi:uncharacterized protein YydD (DUF2326 family)
MEWLQANWFSLVLLAVLVIDRAITRGKRDEKMQQIIDKVDEMEDTFDAAVVKFNEHAASSSLHITPTLTELLKERNDYVKKELEDTRRDVRRIEQMLAKM